MNRKRSNPYLEIERNEYDPFIVVYQLNSNGKPILDERKIMILEYTHDNRENKEDSITLRFDSQNDYQIIRYERLRELLNLRKLKKTVDEKLSKLRAPRLEGIL